MALTEIRPKHVFLLLFLFWLAWIYTEIAEYRARESFKVEVDEFMHAEGEHKGNRFTSEDGQRLEERIKELEQAVKNSK